MSRRAMIRAGVLTSVVCIGLLVLPVERLLPGPVAGQPAPSVQNPSVQTPADPVLRQLCGAGALYARLITHIARTHLAHGGTATPSVLLARVWRLKRLCGDEFALPTDFKDLACQLPPHSPDRPPCARP